MIFDGKKFVQQRKQNLISQVKKWQKQKGRWPKAVFVIVGNNPEGERFVKSKCRLAKEIKVETEVMRVSSEMNQKELEKKINNQGMRKKVDGIVIQLPLPQKFTSQVVLDKIPLSKDIDGLTTESFDRLKKGEVKFLPAVVQGVINVCRWQDFLTTKQKWAVVGCRGWVGERMFWALKNILKNNQSIFRIDKNTEKTLADLKEAEVVISACGQPDLVTAELVKKGVVIFDLGTMIVEGKSIKGDVKFEQIKEKAEFITPVPGGMGPVTVISLFENLLSQ